MDNNMTKKPKKKKKKSNPVSDYLLYLLLRIVTFFVHLVDVNTALRFARFLGRALYRVYHRGRQRALDNLRQSFPEKNLPWLEHTARRSFEHIAMLAFDVLFTSRLIRLSTWRRYIELGDISEPLSVMLRARALIMLTGHYGNFEVLGYTLATFGLESYSIARPIDNPYINKYLLGVRQKQGQIIIDKKGATNAMLDILSQGSILSFIADQNAGRKGVFVDFFHRPASTYKSIALLALEYDLPIVVGYCRRLHDQYRFQVGAARIIKPHEWKDQPDPLTWITAQYTAGIEKIIRIDPEQYWWIHRRWKTRPPHERNRPNKPTS